MTHRPMPKGWLIPVAGVAALLLTVLFGLLAVRVDLRDTTHLPPPEVCLEGEVVEPDTVTSPTGAPFAYGQVTLFAHVPPRGKKSRNHNRKLWDKVEGQRDIHLKTGSGEEVVHLPKPGAKWDFAPETAEYGTLQGVPMVESAPGWRELKRHHGFMVSALVVHSGDHLIMQRSDKGIEHIWRGTREAIEGNDAEEKADTARRLVQLSIAAGIVAFLCLGVPSIKQRLQTA